MSDDVGPDDESRGTDRTSPFDQMLSDALTSRSGQLRGSPGSLRDVRHRARQRVRRRAAVGASALVAVGAIGVTAIATSSGRGDGPRLSPGSAASGSDGATHTVDGGYWECTGPISPHDPAITAPTTPSSLTTDTALGRSGGPVPDPDASDFTNCTYLQSPVAVLPGVGQPAPGPTTTIIETTVAHAVDEQSTTTLQTKPFPISTVPVTSPAPTVSLSAFCSTYAAGVAKGNQPESYVGSAAHIHDIQTLAATAPAALHADFQTYLDFLSSGFVDPAKPETNVVENWPAPVQQAIAAIKSYDSANC